VELRSCNLSLSQLQALFCDLAEGNCSKLKHLDLSGTAMSQVPSEMLVVAIQRLESVDLRQRLGSVDLGQVNWSNLTKQLTALYQMVAERRSGSLRDDGMIFNIPK